MPPLLVFLGKNIPYRFCLRLHSQKQVVQSCVDMVKSWLAQCAGDVCTLLNLLDVEVYEATGVALIKTLLENNETVAIPGSVHERVESALVLRVKCELVGFVLFFGPFIRGPSRGSSKMTCSLANIYISWIGQSQAKRRRYGRTGPGHQDTLWFDEHRDRSSCCRFCYQR